MYQGPPGGRAREHGCEAREHGSQPLSRERAREHGSRAWLVSMAVRLAARAWGGPAWLNFGTWNFDIGI